MFRVADYFIVVGVDRNDNEINASSATATIVDRYPKVDWEDNEFPSEVSMFCMPLGVDIGKYTLEERKPRIFLFSLCSSHGSRRYGTALMFYEEFNGQYGDDDYEQLYSPITLCIISQHPFYTFFSQYLRELYRLTIEGNTIDLSESNQQFLFNLRRVSAKPITLLYTKDDEDDENDDDEKDKDILSPSSKSNKSNLQIPVECYISNLINGYNNVNIEDDGILIKYHIGKRVMECIKPPVDTSLSSILDDECYRSLFHILSIENIITIYECLLLQHKIIFHSKQIENLTLISECLLNLLYPLNWTMCYVSLLPLQLIQCLESPFPYCIGVHSCFLDTDIANECIENCVIVYLDSNRVTVPKVIKNNITHLPTELINILISNLKEITPKPMITVLEEDIDSNYVIFDVIFGPGKIGIKFSTTSCILHKEDTKKVHAIQVVGFEKYDDEKLQSPAEKCGSITTDSILIAINGKSVVNIPIDKVIEMLRTLPRPVVLRFQIGIRPQSMITPTTETTTHTTSISSSNPTTPQTPPPPPHDLSSSNSINSSSPSSLPSSSPSTSTSIPSPPVASLSRLPPLAPSSLKHLHPSPNSTSSLSSSSSSSIISSSNNSNSNIMTSSNVDNDSDTDSQHHHHHHHHHHKRGSSVIGNSYLFSENFKENLWVDKVRSVFLYIMIQLLGDYEHYIIKDKEDPNYPFNSEKYLSSISNNKSKLLFMKQLKDTQSFTSFIEDHLNEVIDNDLQAFITFSREVINYSSNIVTPSPREENESEGIEKRGRKSSIANLFGLGLNSNSNNNIAMEQHRQAIESIYDKINRLNWKIKLYEVEDIKFEQLQSFISNNNIRIEIPITGIFPRFNYQLFDSIKRKDIEFKLFTSNRKDIEIKRNKSQTMNILLNPDRKSSSDIVLNRTERNSSGGSGSNVIIDGNNTPNNIAVVKSRYSLNFNFNFKKSYTVLQKNNDEKILKEEKEKEDDNDNDNLFSKGTKFFKSVKLFKQKSNEGLATPTDTADIDEKEDIEEEEKPDKVLIKEDLPREDKPKEELQEEEKPKDDKHKHRHKIRSEVAEKEIEKSAEKKKSKFTFSMFKKT